MGLRARLGHLVPATLLYGALLASAVAHAAALPVPVPQLPRDGAPVTLRVAYVINPRLPRFDAAQLAITLEAMRGAAWQHYQVRLQFAPVVEIPIASIFADIPEAERSQWNAMIYDFKAPPDPARRERFIAATGANLMKFETLEAVRQYVTPFLHEPVADDMTSVGRAVAALHLERLERWRQVTAEDGLPVLDAHPYNEFIYWVLLVRHRSLPYEVILTNQPIISAEFGDSSPHSAVRGGYTNGITTSSLGGAYRTVSVWSTFAFTATDPWTRELRNDENYSATEAAQLSGVAAVHELGHHLFHFGHPLERPDCIMFPVENLAFRAWSARLDAARCTIGSDPGMKVGAIPTFPAVDPDLAWPQGSAER